MRHLAYLALTVSLGLQWLALWTSGLGHGHPALVAGSAGVAIFGAAFLLSWGAEVSQADIPQALAIAFLALIAVLPEYAVDMYFAWQAPHRDGYAAFATANMTGANRLLIGIGWATVVFTFAWRSGAREIAFERSSAVELFFLAMATLYSFVLPWKANISLWDATILISLFVVYMIFASRAEHEEPELGGPAAWIATFRPGLRRLVAISLFLYSGGVIFTAAEPFAESLVTSGRQLGIEEFLLVQWIAPLASESPEFIVCILFAWMGKPHAGIGALVSSAVNQWTLLVGMLPVVFSISAGVPGAMPLDSRQVEEVLLTTCQSVFALVLLSDLRFSVRDAAILVVLFASQLFFTAPAARYAYSAVYLLLTLGTLLFFGDERRKLLFELPGILRQRGFGARSVGQ